MFGRKFASHWIAPLVSLYLAGDLDGNEINSMVCDLLATVLSWNSVAIPDVSGSVHQWCSVVNFFWKPCKISAFGACYVKNLRMIQSNFFNEKENGLVGYTRLLKISVRLR